MARSPGGLKISTDLPGRSTVAYAAVTLGKYGGSSRYRRRLVRRGEAARDLTEAYRPSADREALPVRPEWVGVVGVDRLVCRGEAARDLIEGLPAVGGS